MDRNDQYKHKQDTVEGLREKRRQEGSEIRKQSREKLLNSKRVRLDPNCEELDVSLDEVKSAIQNLNKSGPERTAALVTLKRAFAQGSLYIDEFLKVDSALPSLVGILSGSDSDLQLEAAWCVTNMATGTEEHAKAVIKQAAPYLITYLSSSCPQLQDQCAWAVGNLAADGVTCRSDLKAQGAIQPLINLLQSSMAGVIQSAAFALSNLARGEDSNMRDFLDGGVVPLLLNLLTAYEGEPSVIAEVMWVLTYITARGEEVNEDVLVEILDKIVCLLISQTKKDSSNFEVLTPNLRCLGNIVSGEDRLSIRACENPGTLPAVCTLLNSEHRHIKKECLWALSNMTTNKWIAEQVLTEGLLVPMVQLLFTTFDIRKEAGYCMFNMASHGSAFCGEILQQGALPGMILLLKQTDLQAVHVGLCFCEIIFRLTQNGVNKFEESDGLTALEALEYHNNQAIRTQTQALLEKYFYAEDSEDEQNEMNTAEEIIT